MPASRHYDAHCHWQDSRLLPFGPQILRDLNAVGVARAVVNGTCPQDWQAVADLACADHRVLPAFGLHPWHVNAVCGENVFTGAQSAGHRTPAGGVPRSHRTPVADVRRSHYTPADDDAQPEALRSQSKPSRCTSGLAPSAGVPDWLDQLNEYLKAFPQAAVGEIGLDNWIEGADKALQREVFLTQLALAAAGNRPVSIHALRADGDLLAALKAAPALPARGIHLHGFAGSVETARQLLDKGAYFSFSEYVANSKRTRARALAKYIPLDRLLAETDAPDMSGPREWQHYRLGGITPYTGDTAAKRAACHTVHTNAHNASDTPPPPQLPPPKHPANITAAYACLAQLRDLPLAEFSAIVENNFRRYFGG